MPPSSRSRRPAPRPSSPRSPVHRTTSSPRVRSVVKKAKAMAEVKEAVSGVPADLLDERLIRDEGLKGYVHVFWNRLRGGELGSLPVVIGLIAICAVFYAQDP